MALDQMLERLEYIKTLGGKKLHMGCGPQILDGFMNVDKYQLGEGIIKADMKDPVAMDVDVIYSSHSLEHLPIRHAKAALVNWHRMLNHRGRLFLAVPDLEEIFRCLLDKNINIETRMKWYQYTLFGYQANTDLVDSSDLEPDPGQFHQCGFTHETISYVLNKIGYDIDSIFKYNGWGTPSLWVEASKAP